MKNKRLLVLLLFVIPFIVGQNSYGNTEAPSVNFNRLLEAFYNGTSIEAFQVETCIIIINSAYGLLLSKKIITNAADTKKNNDMLYEATKTNPLFLFFSALGTTAKEGLDYSIIPAGVKYSLESLYLVSENTFWKEQAINFATLVCSSFLSSVFFFYMNPNTYYGAFIQATEAIVAIFIFQNYGLVALVTSLAFNNSVVLYRMKYLGW